MADKKRAELAALVEDACEGLAECGFLGIMETPVMRVFSDLHKLNDTTNLSKFLAAFEDAATRTISAKKPASFPELMGAFPAQSRALQGLFSAPAPAPQTTAHTIAQPLPVPHLICPILPCLHIAFPLTVLSQLLQDVEGPAAPPEGDDSPVAAEFK